ncbi:MAG: hypothetical protein ACOY3L_16870 [Pseudomonadota bacterium]
MIPRFSRPRIIIKSLVFLVLFALSAITVAVGAESGAVRTDGPASSGGADPAAPLAAFDLGQPMPT